MHIVTVLSEQNQISILDEDVLSAVCIRWQRQQLLTCALITDLFPKQLCQKSDMLDALAQCDAYIGISKYRCTSCRLVPPPKLFCAIELSSYSR